MPNDDNATLWIQNLDSAEDCRELAWLFAHYGAVFDAAVIIDRDLLRRFGGLGRVQMTTRAAASRAILALHGSIYHGRRISVRWARRSELRTVASAAQRPLVANPESNGIPC